MEDVRRRTEERRLELGLTQGSVAAALGVSQPHYSKVVGGVAALTPATAEAMEGWLQSAPSAPKSRRTGEAKRLANTIARQLRELGRLLDDDGTMSLGRPVRRTVDRTGK